jgi:tetratricopeptide (TPR) repeat protein
MMVRRQRRALPMADPTDDVEDLIAQGEAFMDVEEDAEALQCFRAAWAALPEPREEQEPGSRIWAAIADCNFYLGEWEACRQAVQQAFRCGEDVDNPFLRLRLGQALYELGDEQEAANWLVPAYLSEGRALFEDDDPKYLKFFQDRLAPPPGGWPEGW